MITKFAFDNVNGATPNNTQFIEIDSSLILSTTQNLNSVTNIILKNPVDKILLINKNINYNRFEIYNQEGKLLLKNNETYQIDVSHFNSGIYYLKIIISGSRDYTLKFIKR
ncbi:Por secretion system C-terminal sorting domain-containing protein [Soonwooa buanensis]|uniref:Por secretion system C-terminal sorting domain-containing protein n=1 Tax=Soonwooa buanensis TaxID=619805 RepID=A0A1T5DUU5_9FLAO|nr:Por secretion system C-terminal sorting domain-containing protein [Soonwooa buanensis]